MPRAIFLLILCLFLGPAACTRAQAPYLATLSRAGEVGLRNTNSLQPFGTLQVGLFEKGWQLRRCRPGKEPGEALIRATDSGASVAVAIAAQVESAVAESRTLKLTCTLTPDRDLTVCSAQVSLSLPAKNWIRAKATLGENEAIVAEEPRSGPLVGGAPGPLVLTRQGVTISVSAGTQPVLLQDNRTFGGDDLELRVGLQTPEGRLWKAGVAERFDVTLTLPGAVRLVREEPLVIRAGDDWIPLEAPLDIVAGSALDFAPLLGDAPAGKWGRVVVRPDGHFGFEKGTQPVRFWGANLCFSANYLEKGDADRLADRLARLGYNAVRIHHYDGALEDAGNLDRLDYLVAALKKRGLYLKTDLYVSRSVPGYTNDAFKAAVLIDPKALENWKEFARKLLNHVNPYTGLAWKDEPAVAFLSVVNEPNLSNSLGQLTGELAAAYESAWSEWRKGRGLMARALPRSLDSGAAGRELGAFLAETHARGYARMAEFLRREIGTKALLTDLNGWSEAPALMAARTALDFVDNHFYWDHPSFLDNPWQLPSQGDVGGASAVGAGGAGPGKIAMTRLLGKPFTVSEFDYPAPGQARYEGGLLMGAAAALQGWDGIWRFAYAHTKEAVQSPRPIDYFNLASDPAKLATERAAILLFRRGDLKTAPRTLARVLSRPALLNRFEQPLSPGFEKLVLVTRIGTRIDDPARPLPPAAPTETRLSQVDSAGALAALIRDGLLPLANKTNLTLETRQSETNEIFLDGSAGTLRVITPRTMGGVAPEQETLRFGPLTIATDGADAAVWATSLDTRPLTASARLLLSHTTDIQNSGARYLSSERKVLESWGDLPYLVRRGTATVTLERAKAPVKVQGWRLDTAGNRVAPLEVRVAGATLTVELSTQGPDGKATLYYELAIDDPAPPPAPVRPPVKPR